MMRTGTKRSAVKPVTMLVAGSLLMMMAASAASAFVLLSPTRRWFETPRTVNIDSRGLASVTTADHGVAAAIGAVGAWNGGGVNVVAAIATPVSYVLGDNSVDVIFADPLHICTGSCLAATTTGYYDSGTKGSCGSLTDVRITDA